MLELNHIATVRCSEFWLDLYAALFNLPYILGVCPAPPSEVLNGRRRVTTLRVSGTATYTCNPGYALDGPAVLTCLSNGSWNGSYPSCQRKFIKNYMSAYIHGPFMQVCALNWREFLMVLSATLVCSRLIFLVTLDMG